MRKAVTTGIFTGIIISAILIGGTYLRRFLPHTFTANLLFILIFFGSIVATLWLSLNHYCKTSAVRWKSLSITGTISSLIAAMLVSIHGYMYSRFTDPAYIDEILQFSQQKWAKTNNAAESMIGSWAWYQSPVNYALSNFRDMGIVLFVISLTIAAIYYVRNRNRMPDHGNTKNQELIF
jgi:hypothetical protein